MKKIHGTFSIYEKTLTDFVVADDAGIQEHKLSLDYNTDDLNSHTEDVENNLNIHIADNVDPHGATLYQTIIRTVNLETPPASSRTTMTARNAGAGDLLFVVEGDITGQHGSLSSLNVSGQTVMDGNLVLNGNLVMTGETIEVNSVVTDYDVMTITPTTLAQAPGLVVSPDDEGGGSGTYTGDLVKLYKRVAGVNTPTFKVDGSGNVFIYDGHLNIGSTNLNATAGLLTINNNVDAKSVITHENGFVCIPLSDSPTTARTFVAKKANGTDEVFYVTKGGDLWIEKRFAIGNSNFISWDAATNTILSPQSFTFSGNPQYFLDSPIWVGGSGKTSWKIENRANSVSFFYGAGTTPTVEFTENGATFGQSMVTVNNLTVQGNLALHPGNMVDGVDVGSHNHSGAAGMGVRIPATSIIGLQEHLNAFTESVQDVVGGMVSSNTENGISVTYDDPSGKLNFDVSDFTITMAGNISGSVTITNLAGATLTATVLNSAKVAGLSVHAGVNNEANKIVRTDGNGHVQVEWINTISGSNGTTAMDRVYASSDGYIRYYTPANFAAQILAIGATKNSHVHSAADVTSGVLAVARGGTGLGSYTSGNYIRASGTSTLEQRTPAQVRADIDASISSHTHTVVNGMKVIRGSSTFNKTTGRAVTITGFSNTNYSVSVVATSNPTGNLGDVWYTKATGSFTVYNSGSFTGAFDYIIIG